MLSINTGSIKKILSLWLALCILMQVPHLVLPTGSGWEAAEKAAPASLPLSATNLTMNVHLQINSCGCGGSPEEEEVEKL